MLAYHNDPILKEEIVAQMQAHYDADEIIQGRYWDNGKGCAIGCILHDPLGGHSKLESFMGMPRILGKLIDRIFEGLPNKSAKEFPLAVVKNIKIGTDLSLIWPNFAIWLLQEMLSHANQETQSVIHSIIGLYQRELNLDPPSKEEWLKVRAAADAVAAAGAAAADAVAAAAAADDAAADDDADADAEDDDDAVVYAADAVVYAADAVVYAAGAAGAEKTEFYQKMADKLIELLTQGETK